MSIRINYRIIWMKKIDLRMLLTLLERMKRKGCYMITLFLFMKVMILSFTDRITMFILS